MLNFIRTDSACNLSQSCLLPKANVNSPTTELLKPISIDTKNEFNIYKNIKISMRSVPK